MKEQATRLWGWMRHHRGWSVFMLIVLLVGLGFGTFWTVNLVRFGLPPPTGQDCGWIKHSYTLQTDRADTSVKSLACFWEAYLICRAATVSQTLAGTDAGHTDTLTIEQRSNRCAIYGQEEWQNNTKTGSETYLCTQLTKEGNDLQVSGCDGADTFELLARNVIFESYGCGMVNFTASYAYRTPDIEACFFAAYQQCLADSIQYFTSMNAVEMELDFYIDNHCGIGYIRGFPRQPGVKLAACTSLAMRDDGLYFSQCGTDGDIFVPSSSSS